MRIEDELLDRLRVDPTDTETREVYADLLEQQGFAARAAFLRAPDVKARRRAASDDPRGALWRAIVTLQPLTRCASLFRQGCSVPWEQHARTADERARHCMTCNQPVFYFSTLEEIEQSVGAAGVKRCFALDLGMDEDAAKKLYDASTSPA